MSLPDVGKILTEKVVNSVIGKFFKRSSFSTTLAGVAVSAGAAGPVAPIVLGFMWAGIAAFLAREAFRDWVAHKDRVNEATNGTKGKAKK